jgi:protein tyrosine/serine phosphatase
MPIQLSLLPVVVFRQIAAMHKLLTLFLLLAVASAERPATWAQLVKGVENLHKVSDVLYRCGQPDSGGMRELEKLGVKTVINLRDFNDDEKEARGTKLRLRNVDMSAWRIKDEEVAQVLALLRKKEEGPFAVHCWHGADRTGVVCAMYRMVEQGWSREKAIRELKEGGYGFHKVWANIPAYLEKVNVEKVRKRVDELAGKK